MTIKNRLKLVQDALMVCDSDEVTTVGETVESVMVGDLLDMVYERILTDYPWPHLFSKFSLESTPDNHIMKVPTSAWQIDWVKYNKKDVKYLMPSEMQEILDDRDTSESNTDSAGTYTDRDPTYWTSFDDEYIVFDAHDGTLVPSLSLAYGILEPAELLEDTDVPDLPPRFFPVLQDGLNAEAAIILKSDTAKFNVYNSKYKRGLIRMHRWARKINKEDSIFGADYARKRL